MNHVRHALACRVTSANDNLSDGPICLRLVGDSANPDPDKLNGSFLSRDLKQFISTIVPFPILPSFNQSSFNWIIKNISNCLIKVPGPNYMVKTFMLPK